MIDGRAEEYSQLSVEPIVLADEVNLYVYQNAHYVWLAYDYPPGSYGTLDMHLLTETLATPLNLHVSAQLGQWTVGDTLSRPQTPTSDRWWNHIGWISNPLWANGIDTLTYTVPQYNLKNGEAREIQLSKAHFGRGIYKVRLYVNAIKDRDGHFYSLVYPSDSTYLQITVQ